MATTKAQQKAVNKYMKEKYDEIKIRMPKGKKEVIKAHAESKGESVNSFINTAIDASIGGNTQTENTSIAVNRDNELVTTETLDKVTKHIDGTLETPTQFISRAVTDTIDRDNMTVNILRKK